MQCSVITWIIVTFLVEKSLASGDIPRWLTGEACNCNGRSNRCLFDPDLFERTGYGGSCVDCTGNTDGPNCDHCKTDHYLDAQGVCRPCQCNQQGSRGLQCDSSGRCPCKQGVGGDKCDRCLPNHYNFGYLGCQNCGCSRAGSVGQQPTCNLGTGECRCKENVEGSSCDRCKPGYFYLQESNEFGCTPCFCFGHSSICRAAIGYGKTIIDSEFNRGTDGWNVLDSTGTRTSLQYNAITKTINARSRSSQTLFFSAPGKFLGDQRASYTQKIEFTLRVRTPEVRPSSEDVIIEGRGTRITAAIFAQGNDLPSTTVAQYSFVLHEHPSYEWKPQLSAKEFMSILSNITAIKIRATYSDAGSGSLSSFKVHTARRGAIGSSANWIEICTCPQGYEGQHCQDCSPGYYHDPSHDSFSRCVPCQCHGHAGICDPASGQCRCQHNTEGRNCERCAKGYFGNALKGTPSDCTPCPCPGQGSCVKLPDDTIACLECPPGYAGGSCDVCTEGFYGDPAGRYGAPRDCQRCYCNGNVDGNAVGNCDRKTGECLKCIHNTAGFHCDECKPGHYGDALAKPHGTCRRCSCSRLGTVSGSVQCDPLNGQCHCKNYVAGRQCDRCVDGFYNIQSGRGCQPCNCDAIGSYNQTCDPGTGQCYCREGVTGQQCDRCTELYYGLSYDGCKPCDCDPVGSQSLQCDRGGQCRCKENVGGRRCERCKDNKQNREGGCTECPPCYTVVEKEVETFKERLKELEKLLQDIIDAPEIVDDAEFERKLADVQYRVDTLWTDVRLTVTTEQGSSTITYQIEALRRRLEEVRDLLNQADREVAGAGRKSAEGVKLISMAEETIRIAQLEIQRSRDLLEGEGHRALLEARRKSEEFGQQSERMSEISRSARELADGHEREADEIENCAQECVDKSTEAYELAQTTIEQQQLAQTEIEKLWRSVSESERWMREMKKKAEKAQRESQTAFQEALEILTGASSLLIPNENLAATLQSDATDIEAEALRIKLLIETLKSDNSELISKLYERMEEAEELLEKGVTQQQVADGILERLFEFSIKADNAIKSGEDILKEAQETLQTLLEFDKKVRKHKEEARRAMLLIREIVALIESAEKKTKQSRDAMEGAEQDAGDARDIAEEAETTAEEASTEAGRIKTVAESTKTEASVVHDEAEQLEIRVLETSSRITRLEQQATEEEQLAALALKKANEAKTNSYSSQQRVEQALQDVESIAIALQNLQSINTKQLDELERLLNEAERELAASGIEERMQQLRATREQQISWIEEYEEEISVLRIEVTSIAEIRYSLPDGCFQGLRLEP